MYYDIEITDEMLQEALIPPPIRRQNGFINNLELLNEVDVEVINRSIDFNTQLENLNNEINDINSQISILTIKKNKSESNLEIKIPTIKKNITF